MQEHAQLLKVSRSQRLKAADAGESSALKRGDAKSTRDALDAFLRKRDLILPFRPRPYGRKAQSK